MSGHGVLDGGDPSILPWPGFVELSTLDNFLMPGCPASSFCLPMIPTLLSRLGTKLILFFMAFVKAWSYTPGMAQPVQREAPWAIIPVRA